MVARPSLDIELRPLLKALQNRVSDLEDVKRARSDGVETYSRSGVCFMTVELKRDHMFLDLWLPVEEAESAKSSGIAKPHPFEGDEAVRVRFERAEDLSRVSRWLELSHRFAPRRGTAA